MVVLGVHQGVVSLVVDDVPVVADKVIHSETPEEHAKEVKWQRPCGLLGLPVVSAQHRPRSLGLLISCFQISTNFIYIYKKFKKKKKSSCTACLLLLRDGSAGSAGRGGG